MNSYLQKRPKTNCLLVNVKKLPTLICWNFISGCSADSVIISLRQLRRLDLVLVCCSSTQSHFQDPWGQLELDWSSVAPPPFGYLQYGEWGKKANSCMSILSFILTHSYKKMQNRFWLNMFERRMSDILNAALSWVLPHHRRRTSIPSSCHSLQSRVWSSCRRDSFWRLPLREA